MSSAANETLPMLLQREQLLPVDCAWELVSDLGRGQEKLRGECVSLGLDLLDSPDLVAVHDQMSEFVSRIEPGAGAIALVGAEDNDGVIIEGQGEGIHIDGARGGGG